MWSEPLPKICQKKSSAARARRRRIVRETALGRRRPKLEPRRQQAPNPPPLAPAPDPVLSAAPLRRAARRRPPPRRRPRRDRRQLGDHPGIAAEVAHAPDRHVDRATLVPWPRSRPQIGSTSRDALRPGDPASVCGPAKPHPRRLEAAIAEPIARAVADALAGHGRMVRGRADSVGAA